MKSLFTKIRNLAVAGFLFLLPVYVLLVIITKAWASLSSIGTSLAKMFGLPAMLGVGGSTAVSGLLLIVVWIGCGLVVRISFVDAFNKAGVPCGPIYSIDQAFADPQVKHLDIAKPISKDHARPRSIKAVIDQRLLRY